MSSGPCGRRRTSPPSARPCDARPRRAAGLDPLAAAGRLVRGPRRAACRGRRGRRRRTRARIAHGALGGVTARVDGRLRVLDVDPGRRLSSLQGGHLAGSIRYPHCRNVVLSVNSSRSAGVQLHPTSLPGGRLGAAAYAFVDWLAEAGQSWWQMLPFGPPDNYGSPYKARSAFAASPGLLADPASAGVAAEELDFREREAAGSATGSAFAGRGAVADQVRFDARVGRAARVRGGARRGADRRRADLRRAGPRRPSRAPRVLPRRRGRRHAAGRVHGQGQLWGNPLTTGPRCAGAAMLVGGALRRIFKLFDLARIDHFRGFVAYWAVPTGARDALGGRWQRGPGRAVFDAARGALGELPLIAEDLGVITPAVKRLRDELGLPGIVVLQFGFNPATRATRTVSRTTRDTPWSTPARTTTTPCAAGTSRCRPTAARSSTPPRPGRHAEVWWDLIALAFSSPAQTAMVQAQDVLGLGSDARMNTPGTAKGAWRGAWTSCRPPTWRPGCGRSRRRPGGWPDARGAQVPPADLAATPAQLGRPPASRWSPSRRWADPPAGGRARRRAAASRARPGCERPDRGPRPRARAAAGAALVGGARPAPARRRAARLLPRGATGARRVRAGPRRGAGRRATARLGLQALRARRARARGGAGPGALGRPARDPRVVEEPSVGRAQNVAAGTGVPLRRYAEPMISISDNTAADHLIHRLGRRAVEAQMTRFGMARPLLDTPFLTTRELFVLKGSADRSLRAATARSRRRPAATSLPGASTGRRCRRSAGGRGRAAPTRSSGSRAPRTCAAPTPA